MEVDNRENQRLIFAFSNSGEVQAYKCNPELRVEPSLTPDQFSSTYSSSQIVQRPSSGFELITDGQSDIPQWIQNLKSDLEMPSKPMLRHLTTTGAIFGVRWQNYSLRFVGIVIDQSAQSECSWPFWRISDTHGNDVELVQVWYQRVSCMTSPVYCDVRWQPDRGETVSFPGMENAKRMRDITSAWRGRILLQRINPPGRPVSSGNLTRDQFIERAPQACMRLLERFGEVPTDVEIAEELHISRATFYRYLERDNLTLNQIRDMAFRILTEPATF
jgi:hypothetical protein